MTTEANKTLVKSYIEDVWNHLNLACVDDIFTDNYVIHTNGQDIEASHDMLRTGIEMAHQTFPDFKMSLKHMVADGDMVMAHWINNGTHLGEFKRPGMDEGIPASGNPIEFMEVAVFRIEGGKIAEGWYVSDQLTMLQQIGLVPQQEDM